MIDAQRHAQKTKEAYKQANKEARVAQRVYCEAKNTIRANQTLVTCPNRISYINTVDECIDKDIKIVELNDDACILIIEEGGQ